MRTKRGRMYGKEETRNRRENQAYFLLVSVFFLFMSIGGSVIH
jgi:hypothetical protein